MTIIELRDLLNKIIETDYRKQFNGKNFSSITPDPHHELSILINWEKESNSIDQDREPELNKQQN